MMIIKEEVVICDGSNSILEAISMLFLIPNYVSWQSSSHRGTV